MGELLRVENLNVYYGSIHAIKNLSLHVNEGEIVTISPSLTYRDRSLIA